MEEIHFSKEEKDMMTRKIQLYFREELEQEIGSFDAGFLLDFFAEEMGAFYYNRGVYDAEAVLTEKLADVSDLLLQLEKPVSAGR